MFRRGVLLGLVLLLSACGGQDARAPFTDSRIPPGLAPRDWPPAGWTWGLIQVGKDPPQRYGVLGPTIAPRAQVLILPGYGDFAESWYAAAADFAARGYTVWILDAAGQGGSGRWTASRDLGHVASFASDDVALSHMIGQVVRPQGREPFVVVAEGTAGLLTARALQNRRLPASMVILAAPSLRTPGDVATRSSLSAARRLGLGTLRAPGARGWDRADPPGPPDAHDVVRHAWQTANPDLRMGGPSLGWLAAFDALGREVETARPAAGTDRGGGQTPVLILGDPAWSGREGGRWAPICRALDGCASVVADSAEAVHGREVAVIEALLPQPRPVKSPR